MGCANDRRPGAAEAAFFKKIAPYARWSIWTHGAGDPEPTDGQLVLRDIEVGHYEHPYCPDPVFPREDGILGGWNMDFPEYVNPRKYIFPYSPLTQYRNFAEGTALTGGVRHSRREHGARRLLADRAGLLGRGERPQPAPEVGRRRLGQHVP